MLKITADKANDVKQARFHLAGAIDDRSDFTAVTACASAEITLNFDSVTGINSFGIRKMILMTMELGAKRIRYEDCRVVLIGQFNMMPPLVAKAEVRSFYMPFECTGCDVEVEKLVSTEDALRTDFKPRINAMFTCDRCNRHLNFMEDETFYFNFINKTKAA